MAVAKKSVILMTVVFLIVIIGIAAFIYQMSKTGKVVKEPAPFVTFDKPETVEAESQPNVPVEQARTPDVYITPSSSIGISTRDGRNKNVDIRGTPNVAISADKAPVWNLSPNTLPIQSNKL